MHGAPTRPRHTSHKLRRREAEDITISYDVKRCIRAEEYVRACPRSSITAAEWWTPRGRMPTRIANIVQRYLQRECCAFGRDGGVEEPNSRRNEVRITSDGHLYFWGELEIHTKVRARPPMVGIRRSRFALTLQTIMARAGETMRSIQR